MTNDNDQQSYEETTKTVITDFLTQMGLDAEIKVELMPEDSERNYRYISATLNGDNLSELVGYHGKNLSSLQVLLGTFLNKQLPEAKLRLVMDVNSYKKSRENNLKSQANRAADQVRDNGEPIELSPMRPYERRIIHMVLKEQEGVVTESTGDGRDRHIIIKPGDKLF